MLPLQAIRYLHKGMYELILETAYPSLVSENKINGTMKERDLPVLYHG